MKTLLSFGILLALASASPLQRRAAKHSPDSTIEFAEGCLAGRRGVTRCRENIGVPTMACEDKAESTFGRKLCHAPVKEGLVKIDLDACPQSFADRWPPVAPPSEPPTGPPAGPPEPPAGPPKQPPIGPPEQPPANPPENPPAGPPQEPPAGPPETPPAEPPEPKPEDGLSEENSDYGNGGGQKERSTSTTEAQEQVTSTAAEAQRTGSLQEEQITSSTAYEDQNPPTSTTDSQQPPLQKATTPPADGESKAEDTRANGSEASPVPEAEAKRVLEQVENCQFRFWGDVFVFTNLSSAAAAFPWRLRVEIRRRKRVMRFEMCGPEDQGRVVTTVDGKTVYGMPVGPAVKGPEGTSVLCFNNGLKNITVRHGSVLSSTAVDDAEAQKEGVPTGDCRNMDDCKEDTCRGDDCGRRVVSTGQPGQTASAQPGNPQTPVNLDSSLQPCQSGCFTVTFCLGDRCSAQQPREGVAPPAINNTTTDFRPRTEKVMTQMVEPQTPSSGQPRRQAESWKQAAPPQQQEEGSCYAA
ncbi:hypothetical protein GQ602_005734 [Ophiocordyceps camponoti-floridani]|uniref:Uncharacterized protein n=1 Tax=Ophiocordyceps camponoti-floridani TaxID=2030778 RepID=A0A8H4Q3X0_9HYPO|nr:hypothetical protein GQ602_005734 [Ophiocordyceps camponoti-floridani]